VGPGTAVGHHSGSGPNTLHLKKDNTLTESVIFVCFMKTDLSWCSSTIHDISLVHKSQFFLKGIHTCQIMKIEHQNVLTLHNCVI
jgi:hypothetical protein